MNKQAKRALAVFGVLALAAAGALAWRFRQTRQSWQDTTFVMDTIMTQTVYGPNGEQAAAAVSRAFVQYEERLSLYQEESQLAKINAGSGSPVQVDDETFSLIEKSLELSSCSDGAFQITIAPVTLLWGVTTDSPHVPDQSQITAALSLVDDSAVVLDRQAKTVQLAKGQKIDLGGIAKGNACTLAAQIYEEYQVENAVLNLGGNVYVCGRNPITGNRFKVGFRDPAGQENSYIAAVELEDEVMAVSGGYERYFEEDGVRYCHIMDSRTGWPVESDIVSVGVISPEGAQADFWSTTFYVWGQQKTLDYMAEHPELGVVLLGQENVLYVSAALSDRFSLADTAPEELRVEWVG